MKKLLYLLVFIAIAIFVWKYSAMQSDMTVQWKTIAQGGVTLAYPSTMEIAEAMEPYHFLPTIIASLYSNRSLYIPMNYSQDGRVIVSTATVSEGVCYTAPEVGDDKVFDETFAIHGKTWKTISFSDAGAGNRYETKIYRLAQNGQCYEIAETLHYASDFTDIDVDAMSASQQELRAIMRSVVETVRVQ